MNEPNYLVVGGDSLVGRQVVDDLERVMGSVFSTTRRMETVAGNRIFFDFEEPESYQVPATIKYAFVIAAATDYTRCEQDPNARTTNVELIPNAILALLRQGIFVTYISTNSVFGGEQPWPNENDEHAPQIAYARQKSESESRLKDLASSENLEVLYNVVRLTKVISKGTSPIPQWVKEWRNGKLVTPFSDLIFSPISKEYVSRSLIRISRKPTPGNFHLSGSENISYVDFANGLSRKLGVNESLIKATTATEKGVHIAFKPSFSGLGMKGTTEKFLIEPQPLSSVLDDAFGE